ncbi:MULTISPECIES: hypothetical protein [unclassified Streptomyces]|uniref:hypothetical protein n=1 Tax=unclassified Streptomyces TaxID=2593676 RepID=UPI00166103C8|nr:MULTISPECIES: hypothetical protein [unclassified Streptomyces]
MLDTSRETAPAATDTVADAPVDATVGLRADAPAEEPRGCLFALSQPPLMIFLGVIGCLLLAAAVHDLFML